MAENTVMKYQLVCCTIKYSFPLFLIDMTKSCRFHSWREDISACMNQTWKNQPNSTPSGVIDVANTMCPAVLLHYSSVFHL